MHCIDELLSIIRRQASETFGRNHLRILGNKLCTSLALVEMVALVEVVALVEMVTLAGGDDDKIENYCDFDNRHFEIHGTSGDLQLTFIRL